MWECWEARAKNASIKAQWEDIMHEGTLTSRAYAGQHLPELAAQDEIREFWGDDEPGFGGMSMWLDILLPSAVTFLIIYCLVQIGLSMVNLGPGGLISGFHG
jgi:hypothetical protein